MAPSDEHTEEVKQEYRCQGCGELAGEDKINFVKASANRQVRYCNRCQTVRDHFDIRVEDHPQYRLMEVADQIVEADRSSNRDECEVCGIEIVNEANLSPIEDTDGETKQACPGCHGAAGGCQ